MCLQAWLINLILIEHKVVAMTVHNPVNIDVEANKLQILKCRCFTQIFKLTAQRSYTIITVSRCAPKITVTNSRSNQMSNIVKIAASVP